jgi:hypothetical protein
MPVNSPMTRTGRSISVARLRELAAAGWTGGRIDRECGLWSGCARHWATKLEIPLQGHRKSHRAPTDDLRVRS